MPAVTFLPAGLRVECAQGESIFDVGRRTGVAIATSCIGQATCGLCRVKIVGGEAHLTPLGAEEKTHLGNVYFINKVRLSCRARVMSGEVTVSVPPVGDGGGARDDHG